MFDYLSTVRRDLTRACRAFDPDALTGDAAAAIIDETAAIEKLLHGIRLRAAKAIDGSVAGAEGENGPQRWLANHTGQGFGQAGKDIEASKALGGLPSTDEALRNGELSATQAHEVTAAAALDPTAEAALLVTAKHASVAELRRHAKKVRAAATDAEEKAKAAHENRDLSSSVDDEEGEARIVAKGPAATIAQVLAYLEPWIQAEFDKARRTDRRGRRGAFAFDALLAALAFAAACRTGRMTGHGPDGTGSTDSGGPTPGPVGPPVRILVRVDAAALKRGHTVPGETCEIDGLGPVPVEAVRAFLPQAGIDLVITNGVNVFNVTHFGRRAIARQQVVLDWFGGQCSRQGCGATRHLQVDHRIDWAKIKITELRNLDWLCVPCHRRKTHDGWALVHGRGRRQMVPPDHPDHPDHPANAPPDRRAEAA